MLPCTLVLSMIIILLKEVPLSLLLLLLFLFLTLPLATRKSILIIGTLSYRANMAARLIGLFYHWKVTLLISLVEECSLLQILLLRME